MLSDCENCWNTPCTCGFDYLDWDNKNINKFIKTLKLVKKIKKKYKNIELWNNSEDVQKIFNTYLYKKGLSKDERIS